MAEKTEAKKPYHITRSEYMQLKKYKVEKQMFRGMVKVIWDKVRNWK
jgi:hypothetical protein